MSTAYDAVDGEAVSRLRGVVKVATAEFTAPSGPESGAYVVAVC